MNGIIYSPLKKHNFLPGSRSKMPCNPLFAIIIIIIVSDKINGPLISVLQKLKRNQNNAIDLIHPQPQFKMKIIMTGKKALLIGCSCRPTFIFIIISIFFFSSIQCWLMRDYSTDIGHSIMLIKTQFPHFYRSQQYTVRIRFILWMCRVAARLVD